VTVGGVCPQDQPGVLGKNIGVGASGGARPKRPTRLPVLLRVPVSRGGLYGEWGFSRLTPGPQAQSRKIPVPFRDEPPSPSPDRCAAVFTHPIQAQLARGFSARFPRRRGALV